MKRHLKQVHDGKKEHKCEYCGNEYYEKKRLSGHIKREHNNVRDEKCNQCGKLFFTKEVLYRHIRKIHKLFLCHLCHESFQTYNKLVEHKNAEHKNAKHKNVGHPPLKKKYPKNIAPKEVHEKIYCEKCGKSVGKDLNRHVKTVHEGKKIIDVINVEMNILKRKDWLVISNENMIMSEMNNVVNVENYFSPKKFWPST